MSGNEFLRGKVRDVTVYNTILSAPTRSGKGVSSVALFAKTFNPKLNEERTDPFKLSKICNAAGDYCKEVIRETRRREAPAPEQKLEQTQSRGVRR